jgi:molybdopterin converting factor small subunit
VSLGERIRAALGASPRLRVHVIVKGRIGEGWWDVDRTFALAPGTTLGGLLDEAAREGIRLRDAIAKSPHLSHTLMLNGARCPVDDNLWRPLADGDQLYLLAPIAGG